MKLGFRGIFTRKSKKYIYSTEEAVMLGTRYGPGSGPIWLDDVDCDGTETHIVQCDHSGWGKEDCSHSEDVSIYCGLQQYDFPMS